MLLSRLGRSSQSAVVNRAATYLTPRHSTFTLLRQPCSNNVTPRFRTFKSTARLFEEEGKNATEILKVSLLLFTTGKKTQAKKTNI